MLHRLSGLSGLVALATLVGLTRPAAAAPAATVDASQLPAGEFQGVIRRVPGTDRMFTVTVSVPNVTVTPNARANAGIQKQINHINRLQREMLRSKNPASKLAQLQNAVLQLQTQVARV